jgi:hypothetical protein
VVTRACALTRLNAYKPDVGGTLAAMPGRRITVRLEDSAARGWDKLTDRLGITRTGLAEALGQMVDEGQWSPPDEAVARARRIDRDRRRR